MIGIFGGTFDPVHYGHIKPAMSIKQSLQLSQLRFIPNRLPPHRDPPWLSAEQRLILLRLALQDYDEVVIDERELEREGPSYMVDTLRSLQQDFAGERLCLIIGMDAFYGICSWHQWHSLFDFCQLVVTTRPGFDEHCISKHMNTENYHFIKPRMTADVNTFIHPETAQDKAKILLQSVPQLVISSSDIRHKLQHKIQNEEQISQWMPPQAYQKLRGFMNENRCA